MTNGFGVVGQTLRTLLIPLAAFASSAAWADDSSSPWSLGMQLGQARGQANIESAPPADELAPMSYDMAATIGGSNRFGWRVFTGYRFTNYLAVHVGYTDLGESQSRLVENPMILAARMPTFERIAIQAVRGVDVGLQLKLPVTDRIAVDVHGGRYFWQANTRVEGLWSEVDRDALRSKQQDSDGFYGAGMEIGVMHDLSATLGWTRYHVDGEPVSLWTVGALYRFGFY